MNNSVIGFPRIGKERELKFSCERYFRTEISEEELQRTAKNIRRENWILQKESGIDYIPSNDFSLYDNMLDLAVLLNAVPERYTSLGLNDTDTYFAMARGYQGLKGDVKAFAMKKWFNTNYHYIVPEIYDDTTLKIAGSKPFDEYLEAKEYGLDTKPVIIGGFTFLKLARFMGEKTGKDFIDEISEAYGAVLQRFHELGAEWVQIDEPALVLDLTGEDLYLLEEIYKRVLRRKGKTKVLLQTYFGDVRDCYKLVTRMDFDGLGLDFLEGKKTSELLEKYGFPEDKLLFAGMLNGKNIWKSNYEAVLKHIMKIRSSVKQMVIGTSCSLLHVPYTLENEKRLPKEAADYFSFAKEKLVELKDLSALSVAADYRIKAAYLENQKIFDRERSVCDPKEQSCTEKLTAQDFIRKMPRKERQQLQKRLLKLPLLPTTTIGSFPQTVEVKKNRTSYHKGVITKKAYEEQIHRLIKECIRKQEKIGLDVLVHGEYERNDMVEFFGENLSGYIFTDMAWVQSYGTRCVKPPIIFSDVKRVKPITVEYSKYAQGLTSKPVKGMLTGPVTILNWSFPREDISLKEMAFQIALAIREEVLDLEAAGIKIIQIDEAALKEKLPLRREEWHREYLDWAIKAFRLCHSKVKAETQIHTHMCYSEFNEIIKDIDDMDADVISFEASRSGLTILDALKQNQFETEVGPGIYDIHSPRVPGVEEMVAALNKMLADIDKEKLWVNPDCGLKTRGTKETDASLKNLVEAAKIVRSKL